MAPRKRKYTFRRYTVPDYIHAALETLRPPDDITVSQWAERSRILDDRSSHMPGPWRNDMTPYLTGIMDEFTNWETEKIVFCKPTQVGGTEALNNMLGYVVAQDAAPTLIVYPTDELAEFTSDNRIRPMIKACPELRHKFRAKGSTKLELQFDQMYISLTGSNSASGLASKPIRFLFFDEVDKYPGASRQEADPISLATERTKTFSNRKIYMCSTPTLRTGHIWKAKEEADVERHYFVPCPHCGEYIELKFAQIKWPGKEDSMTDADRAECAFYVCQACGAVLNDADKMEMLKKGEWRDVRKTARVARSVAFWMNTLYSPFTRFSEIAKAFMAAKDDPEALHNFTNSWLAEPWEDTKLKTSAELVMDRQTDLPEFTVPDWAKLLTAGVDVQENCLYYTVRAWGDFLTSQLVTRGQAWSFADIERVMNLEYRRQDGTAMLVDLCLIDSGDQTDDVYDFAAVNAEWCLPCKGTTSMLNHYKLSTVNKTGSKAFGMSLVLVDGGRYKDMIASRLRKENGQGAFMVFQGIDREYAEQLTAEHKVTERTGSGNTRLRWVQKTSHADNHYLDCEVYAAAAADVLGVRSLFLQNGTDKPEPRNEKTNNRPQPSSDDWLGGNDNWI